MAELEISSLEHNINLEEEKYFTLEKEARFAWQPLVNLLGAHTYKLDSFKSSSPG